MAVQRMFSCFRWTVFRTGLLCAGFCIPGIHASDTPVRAPVDGHHSPFVEVVRRVQPAVVSISVSKPRGYEFAWDGAGGGLKRRSPAIVRYGSGVIVDDEGYILTNNHVVDGAVRIQVSLSDGTEQPAQIIGQDSESDLALIRCARKPFGIGQIAHLGNSDSVLVGDWVMAIGSPFGFRQTVSVGVISAKGRRLDRIEDEDGTLPYQDFLQTDASINPGNSGGPLVDTAGRVVGINTAYNPGGSGIGFAIPINLAAKVASELRQHGRVVRGYLGILPQDLTPDLVEALGLPASRGVLVGEVESESPAEQGGVERGDVILKVAGHPVTDAGHFLTLIADHRPEEHVEIAVLRAGAPLALSVLLERRPPRERPLKPSSPPPPSTGWPGVEVDSRRSLESRRLGVSRGGQGVVVTYVAPGSPAERKEILRGDIILEIDGVAIWNIRDYRQMIEKVQDRSRPVLFLFRKKDRGHARFVAFRPQSAR